jgi:gliding motility-associated-like protein
MQAQICNGSLGDPVVNINFGQPGNTGPSAYVPSANYTYTASSCPNDGYYTITNRTSDCFNNTWHNVSSDHTGGGNFLLVNAAYVAGDFFLTTVNDLCPNTTYEFSAWMMNMVKPFNSIKPEIIFRIEKPDGTILAFFESGELPVTTVPDWRQYRFLFTTPPGNAAIVLRITDTWPGGYGNDFALDDLSFRPCGAKITAAIQGSRDTVDVCEGDYKLYMFSGNASSNQSPVYQWQLSTDSGSNWHDIPGATNLSYQRLPSLAAGSYWYRLAVVDASVAGITSCRIVSNLLIINVHPKPGADAGPDRVYIKGHPVTLSAIANGDHVSYNWIPPLYMSDTSVLNPTVSPPADIVYTLFVQSSYGCTNKDSVQVKVAPGIFVPDAFTPNGDGVNDYWRIPFLDPGLGAEVNVFNRWGQLVYHVSAATVSWDGRLNGKPQAAGAYVYVISFKKIGLPEIKGVLTLIR